MNALIRSLCEKYKTLENSYIESCKKNKILSKETRAIYAQLEIIDRDLKIEWEKLKSDDLQKENKRNRNRIAETLREYRKGNRSITDVRLMLESSVMILNRDNGKVPGGRILKRFMSKTQLQWINGLLNIK